MSLIRYVVKVQHRGILAKDDTVSFIAFSQEYDYHLCKQLHVACKFIHMDVINSAIEDTIRHLTSEPTTSVLGNLEPFKFTVMEYLVFN